MLALSFRGFVGCLLVSTMTTVAFPADSGVAMLYTNGAAWINGSRVPKAMALFSGDVVQTKVDSLANIKAGGINVLVFSDSLVQFDTTTVMLQHGRVNVLTSKGFAVHVGTLRVIPASTAALTEFEVTDTDGTAKIVARKGDLTLSDGDKTETVAQGQETTRDDDSSKKDRKRGAGAVPGATGGILDSPYAIGVGVGLVSGLTILVLVLAPEDPASPSIP